MEDKLLSLFGNLEERECERPLVTDMAPPELKHRRDRAAGDLDRRLHAAQLPKCLHLARAFCRPVVVLLLIAMWKAKGSFGRAIADSLGLLLVGGVALLVDLTVEIISRVKQRRLIKDPEFEEDSWQLEQAETALRFALNLPEELTSLEILAFSESPGKNGAEIRVPARNMTVECFRREGELCLYDGTRILSLPLAGAKLCTLESGIPVDGSTWLRKDRPDSRKYRKYGVICSGAGQIGLRFCCALEIWKDGHGYRLLFPAYELLKLALLTELAPPKLPGEDGEQSRLSEMAEKEPVRPVFYWRFPKERAGSWATAYADVSFRAAHPKLYVLLVCLGLFVLLMPLILLIFLIPAGAPANGWVILLLVGCLTVGAGLFNIVAAWMHQYLGHWFTLSCLALGGLMMLLSRMMK